MPSLGRRLFSEWLGTAFLLATVVGSGIMAQRLAGGNIALALLGNTHRDRSDAGRADPDLRRRSPARISTRPSSLAFAPRRRIAWRDGLPTSRPRSWAPSSASWAAHVMFELPLWQFADQRRAPGRAMVRRGRRHVRALLTIFGCVAAAARRHPLRGRPLHHRGLLVHRLDLVRQSGRDDRAVALGYICRNRALGRHRIRGRATVGDGDGGSGR